ncbi:MAG: hypothetical protein HUU19_04940 [Phycisphaerales bacterium]|nr:hypothetical protein [Phycisphaerales bacterium]
MSESSPPSFEEWVEYCFTKAYDDCEDYMNEEASDRVARFVSLESPMLVSYLTTLFESPVFLADRYAPDSIAKALWFIFGTKSEYFAQVRLDPIEPGDQVRCIRSVATLYTDLLDRVCGDRGRDPDTDLRECSEIDGAVYMLWDMDYLEGTVMFPEKHPHLLEPGLFVLETVLRKCRTSACLVSALHGIGHCVGSAHSSGYRELMRRLQSLVDGLVYSRQLPPWLIGYARAAYRGLVQ